MKTILLSAVMLVFLIGCEQSGEIIENQDHGIYEPQIEIRSDDECAVCVFLDACCCMVEIQSIQAYPVDLHICGIHPSDPGYNESCSMDTGDGCYDVSNRGIHVVLDPNGQTRQYFCIEPGTSLSLYNANTGGTGWIRVGCTSGSTIGGTYAFNLPGAVGGFARYFQSDAECDFEICDF